MQHALQDLWPIVLDGFLLIAAATGLGTLVTALIALL